MGYTLARFQISDFRKEWRLGLQFSQISDFRFQKGVEVWVTLEPRFFILHKGGRFEVGPWKHGNLEEITFLSLKESVSGV